MNKDIFEGRWEELKGSIQKEWGKLTKNDLDMIAGDSRKLQGKLQEMYGLDEEAFDKAVKKLLKEFKK